MDSTHESAPSQSKKTKRATRADSATDDDIAGGKSSNRKMSHVAAEKKRREAIRKGFELMATIVPDLDVSQSRSESVVLEKTVALLQNLEKENQALRKLAEEHNVNMK